MRRPVVALASLLVTLLALCPSLALSVAWTSPAQVTAASSYTYNAPIALVDESGVATAVWSRYDSPTSKVYVSRQSSGAWTTPQVISDPSRNSAGSNSYLNAVVDSSGVVTALWVDTTTYGQYSVKSARFSSGSWGAPTQVSGLEVSAQNPVLTVDSSGVVTAAWMAYDGMSYSIKTSRYSSGSWASPTVLASTGQFPALAARPDGTVIAVWRDVGVSPYTIRAAKFSSGSWGTPVVVPDPVGSGDDNPPQVVVDSTGTATATWIRSTGNSSNVVASRYDGTSWGAASVLGDSYGGDAKLAVDSAGAVSVLWQGYDGTNYLVRAARFSSGAWSAAATVSTGTQYPNSLSIAAGASGTATAVWSRGLTYSTPQVQSARYESGSWTTPTTTVSSGTASYATVASGGGGRFTTAVWHTCTSISMGCNSSGIWAANLVDPTPAAPANPTAVAGDARATVTVAQGSGSGGVPTSYRVTAIEDNTKGCTVTGASGSCDVTGLTNGTSYTFTATASNVGGTSVASGVSNAVTPQPPVPDTPATPTAVAGSAQVTVTVAQGAGSGGPPASYLITAVEDNTKTCTVTGSSGSCAVTGLANGTSYTFQATATNGGGTSGASGASSPVTPQPPVPNAPAVPTAVAGNAQAAVTVAQGTGSGGAPTSFTVTSSPGGSTCTIAGTSGSCVITGLTNGTAYTFTATATNGGGTSSASLPATPVIPAPTSGSGEANSQFSTSPAVATQSGPPLLRARRPACTASGCTTTGPVPEGATSVVQVAAGGTSSLERRSAGLWANARITNKCRISNTGAGRVFTCATRLRAGTWVVTTEARNGATVIASSSSTWMLVATSKPKHMPVTG
jgi:hypothetical protein